MDSAGHVGTMLCNTMTHLVSTLMMVKGLGLLHSSTMSGSLNTKVSTAAVVVFPAAAGMSVECLPHCPGGQF